MKAIPRRNFIQKTVAIGATAILTPSIMKASDILSTQRPTKDDISLAQWALVDEVRAGKWKTLDFPRIAREDFDINGIEFVNTLFEVPTFNYLKELKQNANKNQFWEFKNIKKVLNSKRHAHPKHDQSQKGNNPRF